MIAGLGGAFTSGNATLASITIASAPAWASAFRSSELPFAAWAAPAAEAAWGEEEPSPWEVGEGSWGNQLSELVLVLLDYMLHRHADYQNQYQDRGIYSRAYDERRSAAFWLGEQSEVRPTWV